MTWDDANNSLSTQVMQTVLIFVVNLPGLSFPTWVSAPQ